jgi:hypothetical protein
MKLPQKPSHRRALSSRLYAGVACIVEFSFDPLLLFSLARSRLCLYYVLSVVAQLTAQLTSLHEQHETAIRETHDLQASVELAHEKHAVHIADLHAQLKERHAAILKLKHSLVEVIDENKAHKQLLMDQETQFQQKLAQTVKEMSMAQIAQYNADKLQVVTQLRTVYEEKITAYQRDLEVLGHQKVEAEARQVDAELRAQAALHDTLALRAKNSELERRLAEAEAALLVERSRPDRNEARNQQIVTAMKEAYRRKEMEFDAMVGVKIVLVQEMKAYRDLLEGEEQRLGIVNYTTVGAAALGLSPLAESHAASSSFSSSSSSSSSSAAAASASSGKRRRVTSASSSSAAAAASAISTDASSVRLLYDDDLRPLVLTAIDLDGHFVRLRNTTNAAVMLNEWQLTNSKRTHVFNFPSQRQLGSGESVTVWCGTRQQHARLRHHVTRSFSSSSSFATASTASSAASAASASIASSSSSRVDSSYVQLVESETATTTATTTNTPTRTSVKGKGQSRATPAATPATPISTTSTSMAVESESSLHLGLTVSPHTRRLLMGDTSGDLFWGVDAMSLFDRDHGDRIQVNNALPHLW